MDGLIKFVEANANNPEKENQVKEAIELLEYYKDGDQLILNNINDYLKKIKKI